MKHFAFEWPKYSKSTTLKLSRGSDEVRPPMIVRLEFVFFPDHQGRAADEENVFAIYRRRRGRLAGEGNSQENEDQKQSFHRKMLGAVFMLGSELLQLAPQPF